MKDSGMEWLGEIPENWIAIKTKFLLGKSGIKIGPFGSALKSDEISSYGPIKVYGQANLIRNDFEYGEKFIDMSKFNSLSVYEIEKEDILISMMGTIGKCSIFPPEAKRGIMDSHLTKLNLNKEKIHSEYFRYAFSGSDSTKTQLDLYSKGSIMSGLNSTIIKNILIPLPTLAEQQKIITFLDEKTSQIDSIIENTKQSIVEFKKYKQALITEAVTKGLNPDVKIKDSGIEWIGEIPEHWGINKLKYMIEFEPQKSEVTVKNIECTFLPMEKLKNGKMNTDTQRIVEEVYSGYSYFKENDIVMAKVTPCFENGNIAIAEGLTNGIGFGTSEIFTIRPKKINTNFLFYRLQEQTFKNKGKSTMYGTGGLKRIPGSFILNYKIGLPTLNEQQQIADYLDEKCTHIDSLIADKEKLINEFEDYKKALIYEYVTGKKEVE